MLYGRPDPPSEEDRLRWLQSITRYRMLNGDWDEELVGWMTLHLDAQRLALLGGPDTASNCLKLWCELTAKNYDLPATLASPGGNDAAVEPVAKALSAAGHWQKMKDIQYFCQGLREMLVRPSLTPTGELSLRRVYPHDVIAWASNDAPDVPLILWQLCRHELDGATVLCWEVFDISDPSVPLFDVVPVRNDGKQVLTITAKVYPDLTEPYPWRRADQRPYLPFAWYHARDTGELWDGFRNRELVRGTLTGAMLNTLTVRAARDVSGNVVIGVNADFGRMATRAAGTAGAAGVVHLEPGSAMEVAAKRPGDPVQIHVIPPGADVEALDRVAAAYESRTLSRAGIRPPDPTAQHGDSRSGYSLALDRSSEREQARAQEPMYLRGDQQVAAITGRLLNRRNGTTLPEEPTDYAVRYGMIPLSAEEERDKRESVTFRLALGIIEPWQAIKEFEPKMSDDECRRRSAMVSVEALIAIVSGSAGRAGRNAAA